jgi:hypothetical protein
LEHTALDQPNPKFKFCKKNSPKKWPKLIYAN